MKEAVYLYKEGQFTIEDASLGVSVHESYPFPETCIQIEEGGERALPEKFTGRKECLRHDHTMKSVSSYKNGVLHGPSYTFFSDGKIASERWYYHGLLHGRAIDLSPQGTVLCEKGFCEGKPHGPFTKRYPSGKILSTGAYLQGRSHGVFKVLDEEGLLLRSTEFCDGRRHGIDQGWTDDGYFLFCEVWVAGEKQRSIVKDFLL